MKLFPDQVDCSVKFEDWLNNSYGMIAGLWASAGYGKSFMVKHLVNDVIIANSNYIPILTSMTHSAVAVLAGFTGKDVCTIHSLMGWVPYVDKETGKEGISTPKMRGQDDARLNSNMLVIIDEAGLLGHDELALLIEACEETGARMLLVGDHKQCFPVVREHQELCIPGHIHTITQGCLLELTIPKRVDPDDVIFKLSQAYRKTVDGHRQPKLSTMLRKDGSGKGIRVTDDLEEIAYKAFDAGKRDGNVKMIKVVTYTNKAALKYNRKIRKYITGLKDPTPIVGEEMVANTSIQASDGDGALIRNNQLLTVVEVEKTISYGMEGAFIQFADEEGDNIEEVIFVPSSPGRLADRLKAMARDAKDLKATGHDLEAGEKWRNFYSLKEGCADIRFTYAMTIQKCQGTTLYHVLVDMWDINTARDPEQAARMAYTAVSRATDYVTIEGELDA